MNNLTTSTENSLPRRSFLRGHFLKSLQTEQVVQQGHNAIRPPWADLAHFYQKCTACDKCVQACEMGILVKGQGGYPEVNFLAGQGECSFCQACVKVCENDVFLTPTGVAWTHKVAINNACLAFNGVECRSCEDSCPSRAIRFQRQLGKATSPTVNADLCNGCGACLSVCPTQAVVIVQNVANDGVSG